MEKTDPQNLLEELKIIIAFIENTTEAKIPQKKENLKIGLPYGPSSLRSGNMSKGEKSAHERDTCALVFIAAEFTAARMWSPLR